MKKALILLLAFVMVVSAGMGFGAAATTTGDSTVVQSADQGQSTENIGNNVNSNEGNKDNIGKDGKDNNKCEDNDKCKDKDKKDKDKDKKETTVIIIQKTIIYKEVLLAAGAYGAAGGAGGAGAANKNAAGGKTVPMQKTGLPILPGILSTLMVGSGLLYGRLRN